MRIPESLTSLFDYGVLEDVVRPLMSGKEAQVYLVVSEGKYAVAKIYKDAQNRTFKHRAEYTEGRKVRNTRDQRAIEKRSKHGRQQDEAAWRSTEVDVIHRLHAAGVRVPVPYHFIDGVLLMELILDADGQPAPRLGDVALDPDAARAIYDQLIREVVKMLSAGIVHGDLSEFNVLVSADGPVIIDFPQSVDSAQNLNAKKLLLRDVDNLHRFLGRMVPGARRPPYAQEMWHLYEQNLLTPDTRLRGDYRPVERKANTASVLELIDDANYDERKRRDAVGMRGGPPRPPYRSGQGGGRNEGHPQGAFSGNRNQGRPQGQGPKKEPAVYQGLPNEGLKSFAYLLDKKPGQGGNQPRGPSRGPHRPNQGGPRQPSPPRDRPRNPQTQNGQERPQHQVNGQPRPPHQVNGQQRPPHPGQGQRPQHGHGQQRPQQGNGQQDHGQQRQHSQNGQRPSQDRQPPRDRGRDPQRGSQKGPPRQVQPEIVRIPVRSRPVPPADPAPPPPPDPPSNRGRRR